MLSKSNELFYKYDKRPEIVCLCGSTRFMAEFQEQAAKLTSEGKIVLTVGMVTTDESPIGEDLKIKLDHLHKRKIDLADSVVVINKFGYIGVSTSSEIDYACVTQKPIRYLYNTYEGEMARVHEIFMYYAKGAASVEELDVAKLIKSVLEKAEKVYVDGTLQEQFDAYAAMNDVED